MWVAALLPLLTFAQGPDERVLEYRWAFPGATAVYLERSTTIRIEQGAGGLEATVEFTSDLLLLQSPSADLVSEVVRYARSSPLIELEAYTLNGKRKEPTSEVVHTDAIRDHIFHDDHRLASFRFLGLSSGSVQHLRYVVRFPDAHLIPGHLFDVTLPTERSTLTVIADEEVGADVVLFNCAEGAVEITRTSKGGRRTVKASMGRMHGTSRESDAPDVRYYIPHAHVVLRGAAMGGDDALKALYRTCERFIASSGTSPSDTLLARVRAIAPDHLDPRTRAMLLLTWVQDHVHYVAHEDGMNGFVPMAADEVLATRYGDCKGMSNLLVTMLRAAGLTAHLAWVGTHDLPYTLAALPMPNAFDHMITVLELEPGSPLFLDPTADDIAFGTPSPHIQGKDALIAIDSAHFRTARVPVMPPSYSTTLDSCRVRFVGAALQGEGVVILTGYAAAAMRHDLRLAGPGGRKRLLQDRMRRGSAAFVLEDVEVNGLDDREAALRIDHRFSIPDLAKGGGERPFSPPIVPPWSDIDLRSDRRHPLAFPHLSAQETIVLLETPLMPAEPVAPAAFEAEVEGLSCSFRTSAMPGTVRWELNSRVDDLLLSGHFDEAVRMRRELQRELNRAIILPPERP